VAVKIISDTGQLAYAAAKAAFLGMTLPMPCGLSAAGVRVCAIAPGPMGTPKVLGEAARPQGRWRPQSCSTTVWNGAASSGETDAVDHRASSTGRMSDATVTGSPSTKA
jgi:NAD(P)-dependent dehydrogenase (short-subunit alcohol dehydrogenase family)